MAEDRQVLSQIHGENVKLILDGTKGSAYGEHTYSGGMAFSLSHIQVNKTYTMIFDGTLHAKFGVIEMNPYTITNIRISQIQRDKAFKVSDFIKIYKSKMKIEIHFSQDFMLSSSPDGTTYKTAISQKKSWLFVNILMGTGTVAIHNSDKEPERFHFIKGENITLRRDNTEAKLKCTDPSSICIIAEPLKEEEITIELEPYVTNPKETPRNYHVTLAYSHTSPEKLRLEEPEHFSLSNHVAHQPDFTSKVKEVYSFARKSTLHEECQGSLVVSRRKTYLECSYKGHKQGKNIERKVDLDINEDDVFIVLFLYRSKVTVDSAYSSGYQHRNPGGEKQGISQPDDADDGRSPKEHEEQSPRSLLEGNSSSLKSSEPISSMPPLTASDIQPSLPSSQKSEGDEYAEMYSTFRQDRVPSEDTEPDTDEFKSVKSTDSAV